MAGSGESKSRTEIKVKTESKRLGELPPF